MNTMESQSSGHLGYAMQLNGDSEENLRLLKQHVDSFVEKAVAANYILDKHYNLAGWDPTDPNQGILRAQNALLFLQAARVGMGQLVAHYAGKERHLAVVEVAQQRVEAVYARHADLIEEVS